MSTKIRLRALFALLAVAVLSVGIAACGDDDETTTSGGGGLIEANPDNSGVADHGRVEELHRAVHPRRDLRAGAGGRRLRRQHGPQPGRRDGRPEGPEGRRDRRLPRVHLDGPDLVLRHQPGGRPVGRPAGVRGLEGGLRRRGPGLLPAGAVLERQRRRHADLDRRRARAGERLRPRGPVAGPDPLRLAGVPPAAGLPGRARGRLRARVQGVHAGRHRLALRGARQGPGRPLDPVHERRPAVHGPRQVHDPRGRQGRLPGRELAVRRPAGDRGRGRPRLRRGDRAASRGT